jgi:nucleoside-diphosphate-sugar epimerase
MTLSVLYIGGTGQISLPCVEASVAAGHNVTVLNRGKASSLLPPGVEAVVGDMTDDPYKDIADRRFDVVAQFRVYTPEQMQRDIATFAGKTSQYVFISSASVYEKPVQNYLMTERSPQSNPFWQYSRNKIDCERMLRDQRKLAYTIVRPSHTVRTAMPIQVGDPDIAMRRMLRGKPVIVAGDGTSLWTLTRAVDVARAFVRLLGHRNAMDDDFHITTGRGFSWNQIHEAIARGLGVKGIHASVPTSVLISYNTAWEGPLMGDKTWSALFDNTKIKTTVGEFDPSENIDEILFESLFYARQRLEATPTEESDEDRLIDRIIAAQAAVRP